MTHYQFEGRTDYIAVRPALILTLEASGSITAGRGVSLDAGGSSDDDAEMQSLSQGEFYDEDIEHEAIQTTALRFESVGRALI